jgi:hypothetical protein
MNSKDIVSGCVGNDDRGEFVVETVVTSDPTNGVQAVTRRDGVPSWLSLEWDVEVEHIVPSPYLKRLPVA